MTHLPPRSRSRTSSHGRPADGFASAAASRRSSSSRCASGIAACVTGVRVSHISPRSRKRSSRLMRSIPRACKVGDMGFPHRRRSKTNCDESKNASNAELRGTVHTHSVLSRIKRRIKRGRSSFRLNEIWPETQRDALRIEPRRLFPPSHPRSCSGSCGRPSTQASGGSTITRPPEWVVAAKELRFPKQTDGKRMVKAWRTGPRVCNKQRPRVVAEAAHEKSPPQQPADSHGRSKPQPVGPRWRHQASSSRLPPRGRHSAAQEKSE